MASNSRQAHGIRNPRRSRRRGRLTPTTGASAPNLVMSTTFAVDEPAGFSIHGFEGKSPYLYTRWANPTVRMLEEKLAALEGAEGCVAFASGMAATSALLATTLARGDHLVVSDVNYAGTAELIRTTLADAGVEFERRGQQRSGGRGSGDSPGDAHDLARDASGIRFCALPTSPPWRPSPSGAVCCSPWTRPSPRPSPRAPSSLARTSWCIPSPSTSAATATHSAARFLGSAANLEPLRNHALVHHGGCISPFNAWLIARGAATLPIRMQAHEQGARRVAEFLERHRAVTRVNYPGLESHPQHALAQRQMANASGTLSFQVRDGAATARRMARELEIVHFAVSLGHHRSLIYWIETDAIMASTFKLSGVQLAAYRQYAGDGLFRLSVGLEDADDICEDLDRVLAKA